MREKSKCTSHIPGVKFRSGLFSLMINRDNWGNLYLYSSGEMRRQYKDKLMRKHLAKVFSLIKNESSGIEDDQIPL